MTFKINGTTLITQPSNHKWLERTKLGFNGQAQPIYVAPRQYELDWDWIEADAFAQLIGFYNGITGTCKIDLPTWDSSTGGYSTYSATLQEPTYSNSFEGFYGSAKLLVLNIK